MYICMIPIVLDVRQIKTNMKYTQRVQNFVENILKWTFVCLISSSKDLKSHAGGASYYFSPEIG